MIVKDSGHWNNFEKKFEKNFQFFFEKNQGFVVLQGRSIRKNLSKVA